MSLLAPFAFVWDWLRLFKGALGLDLASFVSK